MSSCCPSLQNEILDHYIVNPFCLNIQVRGGVSLGSMQEYVSRAARDISRRPVILPRPYLSNEQFLYVNSHTSPILPPVGVQNRHQLALGGAKTVPFGPIVVNQYASSGILNQNRLPQLAPRVAASSQQFRIPCQPTPVRPQVYEDQVDPACHSVLGDMVA